MKIAVIGAGAMGSVIGGLLAKAGNDVTLVDVWKDAVVTINAKGLRINDEVVKVRATDKPADVGLVDVILIFVKCYHTEEAVRNALGMIGAETVVLSLQNGWGNGQRIAKIVGEDKLLIGVCYHSATVSAPGHVLHVGKGMTFIGELNGKVTQRLTRVAEAFQRAGIEVTPTPDVLKEIWSKLALNVCTLPTSALLRFYAPQLVQHEPMLQLMKDLLHEVIAVARPQKIALDFNERWGAITGLLRRCAPTAKSSMLQDVEKSRRTEIDVINGAIVEAGERLNIGVPYNRAMVAMMKSLEGTFQEKAKR
jgi:2-dehydropantoate 2-reductase